MRKREQEIGCNVFVLFVCLSFCRGGGGGVSGVGEEPFSAHFFWFFILFLLWNHFLSCFISFSTWSK